MHNKNPAVLIINLGSPKSPTSKDLKPYLRQFLSDTRIIETKNCLQKWLWQAILNAVVLQKRPKDSAKKYKSIWLENDSPLLFFTRETAQKLREKSNHYVDFAMRYGNPSIPDKLAQLQQAGFHKIVIVPMYAQYSSTTIASIMDEISRYLLRVRNQPRIRALQGWFNDSGYIEALAKSIESQDVPHDVLVSFHGIPQKYSDLGDPYRAQCEETLRLLAKRLPQKRLHLGFQSRFGPAKWLEPYTIERFQNLAQSGISSLAVICPGFCADCLETLEEIAISGKKTFLENGGKNFIYIPALNINDFWLEKLWNIIQKELKNF